MHIRFKRLVVATVAAVSLSVGLMGALGTTAAHAAPLIDQPQPCSQDTCNGLDPSFSFQQNTNPHAICSDGAGNVGDLPNGVWVLGGLLELRWGPNCQTNWVRFTPGDNDPYSISVFRDSDFHGGGEYQFSGAQGVTQYSNQVYSPGPVTACVADIQFQASACYDQATGQVSISPAV